MKTRYKIIIIVTVIAVAIPGIMIFGAVPLMITTNAYSGFIMSSTSDETFEEDFKKISEVELFIEKYPNLTTNHSADFLGWKIINYDANVGQNVVHLSVKKSVLHQGVKISAGCSVGGPYNYALNILDDDVMDYLKNNTCLKKSEPDIVDSLKIPNTGRDSKLAAGYELYPGVGWVHPDAQEDMQPIYKYNPDNYEELILDIDSMMQVQKILNKCDYVQKLRTGEISAQNQDRSYNAITGELLFYNNGTHYIDSNTCEWESISGKTVTGSYELEDALCIGGRGIIKNENCEMIGKYDPATGMPIVENKEQCDMLEGDWDEEQKTCNSKYGLR